jgi:hypothetical protein
MLRLLHGLFDEGASLFLLKLVLIMNLLDGIFTIFWVDLGLAVEANPLMNAYYAYHPIYFMLVKNILVCGAAYLVAGYLRSRRVRLITILAFCLYFLILSYHILMLHVLAS